MGAKILNFILEIMNLQLHKQVNFKINKKKKWK